MNDVTSENIRGFTLIEMPIVLVIIGLIVGGILVGKDLIGAAGVRATITQIEKYQRAANTFKGKYGELPGDLDANTAATVGFAARGAYAGEGDGNGIIEGMSCFTGQCNYGWAEQAGETVMFWEDLSQMGFIDGGFTLASAYLVPNIDITGSLIGQYIPEAKIGNGNYIYVYSVSTGVNYYGLSGVNLIGIAVNGTGGGIGGGPAISVRDA